MSNREIIVLDSAEAVPVRALADRLRMHPVDVVKDLRGRGYKLGSIAAQPATGRWRSGEMTPNAISSNAGRDCLRASGWRGWRAVTMHSLFPTPGRI